MMFALVRLPLVGVLYVCVVEAGLAQGPQPKKPPALKDFTVEGTVDAVQFNLLRMTTAKGQQYSVILFPREYTLRISGMAKPDFLKPGMLVSFNAILPKDKNADVETPPTDFRLISKSETNKPGVFDDKEKPDTSYVCGTVRSLRSGKLTITAGKQMVIPLPADLEIKVQSADPALIRPGDSIKVVGEEFMPYVKNVQEGSVTGKTVDIKLRDILTFVKKKPGGK